MSLQSTDIVDREEMIFRSERMSFVIFFGLDANTPDFQIGPAMIPAEIEIWSNTSKGHLKYAPCTNRMKAAEELYSPSRSPMKFLSLKNLKIAAWTLKSKNGMAVGYAGYRISGDTYTDNPVVVYVILREVEVDIFLKALDIAFPLHEKQTLGQQQLPPRGQFPKGKKRLATATDSSCSIS